ncbi:hypothetical protein JW905_06610, partial [bacterium]|nr:hypothetical protein [candidate division CSSED10-310 bacterium]
TDDPAFEYDLMLPVLDVTMPAVEEFTYTPASPEPGGIVTMNARVVDGAGVAGVTGAMHSYDTPGEVTFTMYDDGAHSDGAAGDSVFGAVAELPDAVTFFVVDITAADGLGNTGTARAAGGIATVPFVTDDPVLIVSAADNDLCLGLFAESLEDNGYGYDVWSWYRGIPPTEVLDAYVDGAVIWFYSHTFPITTDAERAAIEQYLNAGGNLLITEQDLGWFLVEEGSQQTEEWYRDVLLAEYIRDGVSQRTVEGLAGDPVGDGLEFGIEGGSGANNQGYPSLIEPIAPAESCLLYQGYPGPESGTAAIRATRNGAKHVYLAFGFEGIGERRNRAALMGAVMTWFGVTRDGYGRPFEQAPGWWLGGELPTAAADRSFDFCDLDGMIYFTGGLEDGMAYGDPLDPAVYCLSTIDGSCGDTGSALTDARMYHVTACLEGPDGTGVYFLGGVDSQFNLAAGVEVMDPLSGAMYTLDSDPLPAAFEGIPGSTAVCGNKVYIIGQALIGPPWQNGDCWVFDPMASPGQKWEQLDLQVTPPRFFCATAVAGDCIYLMGGVRQIDQSNVTMYDKVVMLDTSAAVPAWDDSPADLPAPMFYCGGAAVPEGANVPHAGHIFLSGGFGEVFEPACYFYDPAADEWRDFWPPAAIRMVSCQILYVPSARGPELWLPGGYGYSDAGQEFYANCEVLHLGADSRSPWINIRTNQTVIPGGATLRLGLDIAGDHAADAVDCYIALEVAGAYYFLTAEPYYPNFTEDGLPIFAGAPLGLDFTYSGPLLELPMPDDVPTVPVRFYAATLYSGTADLAGGLAWSDVTILENQ